MIENEQSQSISLYYQEGGSDKVYNATIEKVGDGFLVNFAFGRRGATLQTGTKTTQPVSYETAKKFFNQLINAKKAKGYTEGEAGTPYIKTDKEERISGINCQLLNPIEEKELMAYLENDMYGAQEKMDGNRLLVKKVGSEVEGINRKGLLIAISALIQQQILLINSDFVLDGESIGDTFYVFDLLSANGEDLTSHPFQTRFATLQRLIVPNETIKPIVLATSTINKKQLLASLQAEGKEGIVLKDLHAPYKPGRPASGGSQVKYKFYDTASVKVEKLNLKRSVSMCLSDDGKWISVGNVTIPPNYDIPSVDDIIEVRYLYAYRGGSLYQPTYLGKREDLDENDCQIKQLKYKSE